MVVKRKEDDIYSYITAEDVLKNPKKIEGLNNSKIWEGIKKNLGIQIRLCDGDEKCEKEIRKTLKKVKKKLFFEEQEDLSKYPSILGDMVWSAKKKRLLAKMKRCEDMECLKRIREEIARLKIKMMKSKEISNSLNSEVQNNAETQIQIQEEKFIKKRFKKNIGRIMNG